MISTIRGKLGLKSSSAAQHDKGKDDKDRDRDEGHNMKTGMSRTSGCEDDNAKDKPNKSIFKKLFKGLGHKDKDKDKDRAPHEEQKKPKDKDPKLDAPAAAPVHQVDGSEKRLKRKKLSVSRKNIKDPNKADGTPSVNSVKTGKQMLVGEGAAPPPNSMATSSNGQPIEPQVKEEISKWAEKIIDRSVPALKEDFKKLEAWNPENTDAVACNQPDNLDKCRVKDIPCFEATRVKLKTDAFIHANYVQTDTGKYICTQAPLDNTTQTFWQMAVEENCESIIMLCNVTENGQKKCAEYYPQTPGGSATFGDYTVKTAKGPQLLECPNIESLTLQVTGPSGQISIKHFHVTDWPEKGVPESVDAKVMNVLGVIRSDKAVIVHSSLGVGRAGMLILTEYMHSRLMSGKPLEDSIEALKEIRRQRAFAVPNYVQYIYTHRMLLHYLSEKKILELTQRYLEFVDDYDAAIRKWKSEEGANGGK